MSRIVGLVVALFKNTAVHIAVAWVALYWLGVYVFGSAGTKFSTEWISFAIASLLTFRWMPNSIDAFIAQWREGRHRLAMGLNVVFFGLATQQLWAQYLVSQGEQTIRLDNAVSGFIKAIILGGMLLCLSSEASSTEFVRQRGWYNQVVLAVFCVMLGFAAARYLDFGF